MKDGKRNLVNGKMTATRPGAQARKQRRERIKTLTSVIRGNHGWRQAFAAQFPQFDTPEGAYAFNRATSGRTDDPMLLAALENFIPWVISTEPIWWVKRPNPMPEL
jgi:hypothetical protein